MKSDTRIAWLIAFAIAGVLLYLLAPVLTPFVAAALLAYIGDPLADRLQALGLSRTLAVIAVFLLTFLFIGALILLVGPLIRQQVIALFESLPAIASKAESVWLPSVAGWLDIELGDDVGLGAFLSRYGDMAGTWGGKALSSVTSTGSMLAAAVMSLFLVPILTFYLLRDWDRSLKNTSPRSCRKASEAPSMRWRARPTRCWGHSCADSCSSCSRLASSIRWALRSLASNSPSRSVSSPAS